ncbi:tumor necrosis factor b (TNF superfamily, member 2) [Paramisgurnus dabryanus]|uniref:tumor necrosis factor b (TNF superfamily, member 2) n=1 Tax=Paramisgurnus dabryanus TaxID=90735 RepID=UPI0031F367AC
MYQTTVIDLEAGMDGVYQKTVVPVPVKSSRSWIWKTLGAIIFVSLCAVASVFIAWHFMEKRENVILSEKYISTPPSEHEVILQQIAERTKAAIHLHGERGDSAKQEIQWVTDVDQSFEQGGLKLTDNEIRIPADGLYFVYSQVSYAVKCSLDEDDESVAQKYLSHTIMRFSDAMGQKMPLQNSAHSICKSGEDGKTMYRPIYLGAVFKLLEGDRLSTKTTNVDDVEQDYAKTFFGVFAL